MPTFQGSNAHINPPHMYALSDGGPVKWSILTTFLIISSPRSRETVYLWSVNFCGSRDFCWTYHGRVLPYSDEMELEARGRHKKPKTTDNYKKGVLDGV